MGVARLVVVPGFNHNIKHKGRVYHVQTEDSGLKNPHIITHLFVGGNIVSSKKTQYADLVGQPEYEATVRKMMEEQHKQMLRSLVSGAFDAVEVATAYHLDGPAPVNYTSTSPTTSAIAGGNAFKGLPSQLGRAASVPTASGAPSPGGPADLPRASTSSVVGVGSAPALGVPRAVTGAMVGVGAPLPRAATGAMTGVGVQGVGPAPASGSSGGPPANPAAERSTTIFGEDLISEKSLDEVILSYLAEDLSDLE